MIPISEVPPKSLLRARIAEHQAPFTADQVSCYLLFMKTANAMSRALSDFFAHHDLTLPRWSVMALLYFAYPEGLTTTQIAEKKGVSKASASSVIESLVREKLLVRLPDPDDRRSSVLRLSPAGHRKIDSLREDYMGVVHSFVGGLDEGEIAVLERVLEKFVEGARASLSRMEGMDD